MTARLQPSLRGAEFPVMKMVVCKCAWCAGGGHCGVTTANGDGSEPMMVLVAHCNY